MKMLITGSNGMLAKDFIIEAENGFEVIKTDREELDITKKEAFEKIKADIVVNCAAYTNVDAAEKNRELCYNINTLGVQNIADFCKKENIPLVHISTDYVFDGKKESYDEDDKKNPLNYYGETKAAAEDYIIKNLKKYYIIRTSWLFGKGGKNFIEKIKELLKTKDEIKVVNDQFGRPTYTKDLSKAIIKIISEKKPIGVYNITNSDSCSWFEYAKEIAKYNNSKCKILPCLSSEYLTDAKRPKYSVLNNNKIEKLRSWKDAVKEYMGE